MLNTRQLAAEYDLSPGQAKSAARGYYCVIGKQDYQRPPAEVVYTPFLTKITNNLGELARVMSSLGISQEFLPNEQEMYRQRFFPDTTGSWISKKDVVDMSIKYMFFPHALKAETEKDIEFADLCARTAVKHDRKHSYFNIRLNRHLGEGSTRDMLYKYLPSTNGVGEQALLIGRIFSDHSREVLDMGFPALEGRKALQYVTDSRVQNMILDSMLRVYWIYRDKERTLPQLIGSLEIIEDVQLQSKIVDNLVMMHQKGDDSELTYSLDDWIGIAKNNLPKDSNLRPKLEALLE